MVTTHLLLLADAVRAILRLQVHLWGKAAQLLVLGRAMPLEITVDVV